MNIVEAKTVADRTAILRRMKPDESYCPRCDTKTIDIPNRLCVKCKGKVIFSNRDDGNRFDSENEHYYVWYRSPITNVLGWYDKSYFEWYNKI